MGEDGVGSKQLLEVSKDGDSKVASKVANKDGDSNNKAARMAGKEDSRARRDGGNSRVDNKLDKEDGDNSSNNKEVKMLERVAKTLVNSKVPAKEVGATTRVAAAEEA